MTTIVNQNLSGATVTYNGVQFGGADANYAAIAGVGAAANFAAFPPMYSFRAEEHWDESRRALMWIDYTIFVRCIFTATSEAFMSALLRGVQNRLVQPRAKLTIAGLGSGLGLIANLTAEPLAYQPDIFSGPFPLPIEFRNIGGQLAWEVDWGVRFSINPCVGVSTNELAFTSFNFNTTWQNDFEGVTTRTIQGSVTVPHAADYNSPKEVAHIAEQTRGDIIVALPVGFRRVSNVWRENDDKTRLDFSIVDEQLRGDPLPNGVVIGSGSFGISFNAGEKLSMSKGIATLNMSLKTSLYHSRDVAGRIFLAAALSKQTQLSAIDGITGLPTIQVIPIHLSFVNQFWEDCRVTNCSIAWLMIKSVGECLAAANVWDPINNHIAQSLGTQNYTTWRNSLTAAVINGQAPRNLWSNLGTSLIRSNPANAEIVDICNNYTSMAIGQTGGDAYTLAASSLPSLTCPDIPTNGGWVHFDLNVTSLRTDTQSTHRRAASYIPTLGELVGTDPLLGVSVKQGGPEVSQTGSDEHVTEYHGYPETLIGLTFSGLRFKNKAYVPEIITVNGKTARLKQQEIGATKYVFDVFGCPVYSVEGYRVYSIPGHITELKITGSKTNADGTIGVTVEGVF